MTALGMLLLLAFMALIIVATVMLLMMESLELEDRARDAARDAITTTTLLPIVPNQLKTDEETGVSGVNL